MFIKLHLYVNVVVPWFMIHVLFWTYKYRVSKCGALKELNPIKEQYSIIETKNNETPDELITM